MQHQNRRAFVLVELSVSVAIVASFIALLLPAVQRAQEVSLNAPVQSPLAVQSQPVEVTTNEVDNTQTLLPSMGALTQQKIAGGLNFINTAGWTLQLHD